MITTLRFPRSSVVAKRKEEKRSHVIDVGLDFTCGRARYHVEDEDEVNVELEAENCGLR